MLFRIGLLLFILWSKVVNSLWAEHFAARIIGEEYVAKELAELFGVHYLGQVFPDLNYYRFKISALQNGRKWIYSTSMFLDKRVKEVLPQTAHLRVIKDEITVSGERVNNDYFGLDKTEVMETFVNLNFNDPFFPNQWYFNKEWMNVFPAWSKGFNGEGITSTVLDDGLDYKNPDLCLNYKAEVSYDVSDLEFRDPDPSPDMSLPEYNSHGTHCAAIISATANNYYCGVGIAYKAKVGAVRLLNGKKSHVNDVQEALALAVASTKNTDIVVSSWGPPDDGKNIGKPGKLAKEALIAGIKKGRDGKGAVFVWAVGNGGLKDNCNLDGYASSIYTIAISSLTKSGYTCVYDEPCSAALASCYVGGRHERNEPPLHLDNMVVPQLNGGCTNSFQGTSAAAPLAAGIVALMLQANSNLTWRDIQHIIVKSARKPTDGKDWHTNGADLWYHHFFGFGAIDASKAVDLATTWLNIPVQSNFTLQISGLPSSLLPNSNVKLIANTTSPLIDSGIFKLEHTVLNLTLNYLARGKIELFVISPSGTESQLLSKRPLDDEPKGFKGWSFMSTHFWLENPNGIWKIIICNHSGKTGMIEKASITFFGSYYKPV